MKYIIRLNCSCCILILLIISLLCFTCIKCCSQVITHVTLTCYQPVKSQTNQDNLTTSDGSKINLHHLKNNKIKWCAISRDLLWLFNVNSKQNNKSNKNKNKYKNNQNNININNKKQIKKVYIEGFGIYEVRDVMNKRHKHRIDLLIHPKDSKRIKFDKVKVTILN